MVILAITVNFSAAQDYASEIHNWRTDREARLIADDGWLTVAGLFFLAEGDNTFGASPLNDIVLRTGPETAGVFTLHEGTISVRAAYGEMLSINEQDTHAARLWPYEGSEAPTIILGPLMLFAHYSGDRLAIRMRDRSSEILTTFTGLKWFPVDDKYRVRGRYELFKLSLPTPIMAGVRTPTRQFSSCVLIETGDSLDSINATASAIVKYVSQRAGIGVNAGRIRALGSPIRGGEAFHTGCIPFYKYFQTAVKSCSQGGVRGGAATLFYPIWHMEIESLLVLKNNRGVEENRVRHLDYGVQFNKLMYQRMMKDDYISLFSPSDVPGLYDAFFADQNKFEALYVQYENDDSIRKKRIKAMELFSLFMQERASTGRIYLQNVDHCNTHSPFNPEVAPVRQSNLCLEIALPTKPLQHVNDENGEIALCTLSAFNLGAIESLDEFEELADLAVRALDNLLDYQDYPVPAAYNATMGRRTLGVGVINFAYYLAKNGVKYSDHSANGLVHRTFEAMQYYLLKASNNLAKEKGACPKFNETTYSQGIMPIDSYKKELDSVCNEPLHYDWDALREEVKTHGLRNSTLSALMPSETSSQISNATNGIEPPRGFISIKSSKDGILKQVVPEYETLKDKYELLWDIPSNDGYLQLVGIMQKFIDQTISANTNYDPSRYDGNKVPMKLLLKDLLTTYKLGVKTLYYHNTRDGATDATAVDAKANVPLPRQEEVVVEEDDDCAGGACKI